MVRTYGYRMPVRTCLCYFTCYGYSLVRVIACMRCPASWLPGHTGPTSVSYEAAPSYLCFRSDQQQTGFVHAYLTTLTCPPSPHSPPCAPANPRTQRLLPATSSASEAVAAAPALVGFGGPGSSYAGRAAAAAAASEALADSKKEAAAAAKAVALVGLVAALRMQAQAAQAFASSPVCAAALVDGQAYRLVLRLIGRRLRLRRLRLHAQSGHHADHCHGLGGGGHLLLGVRERLACRSGGRGAVAGLAVNAASHTAGRRRRPR